MEKIPYKIVAALLASFSVLLPLFSQQLPVKTYKEQDGFPPGITYCLYQDSGGFLWLGSQNGLNRYDGVSLHDFSKSRGLPGDDIVAVAEDGQGNMWASASEKGVVCFSGSGFQQYGKSDGLPHDRILCISTFEEGAVWFGTWGGLSRFDGKRFKSFGTADGLPSNCINCMVPGGDGSLLLGTDKGLCSYAAGGFSAVPGTRCLADRRVVSLLLDSKGRTWIGLADGLACLQPTPPTNTVGLSRDAAGGPGGSPKGGAPWNPNGPSGCKLVPTSGLLKSTVLSPTPSAPTSNGRNVHDQGSLAFYSIKNGLGHTGITSIKEDCEGRIWVGTLHGLALFDGTGFTNFTRKDGLPGNDIIALLVDRESNLWIATDSGICRLSTLNVTRFSTADGLPHNTVDAFAEDKDGRFWIGTNGGLACLDGAELKVYTTEDGLVYNYIHGLTVDRSGDLWIATYQGLSRFSAGGFTNYTTANGLKDNTVFAVSQDRNGTLWIGLRGEVQLYRDGEFSAPPFKSPGFSAVHILEDRRGRLWFASREGLFMYSARGLRRFGRADGLPDSQVNSSYQGGDGRLWFACEGGLGCYAAGEFVGLGQYPDVPQRACYFVEEDTRGHLWIGTADGLLHFDGNRFKTYTVESHGLLSRAWYTGRSDRRGRIWMGGSNGVTRFSPPPFRLNNRPPPVHITGVKVLEQPLDITAAGPFRFRHHRNYIRFHFTGICLTAPESVVYKYRLSALERQWKTTGDRSLFYPYLPPGEYDFQVKAVNNDGYQSTQAATFSFTILPPFHQTWWFRSLIFLAISGVLMLVFWWRIRRAGEKAELRAQQAELKAKKAEVRRKNQQLVMSQRMQLLGTLAAGAVHDLKSLLAVIIGYSRMAARSGDTKDPGSGPDPRMTSIEHIKGTAHTAVTVVGRILAFTKQQYNESVRANLPDLMEEILDVLEVTKPGEVELQWNSPVERILFDIDPTRFQQLVMNLCINAFHAMPDGGNLTIDMKKTGNKTVSMSFTDTGTGIPEQIREKIFEPMFTTKDKAGGTGLGLFVVDQIVKDFNGTIEVQSTPGKGTVFTVLLN